jgi:Tol biopolymer transport system component
MFSFAVSAALVLSYPPPKPADNAGRITLWVDKTLESFDPDGKDLKTTPMPDEIGQPASFKSISPDHKTVVFVDSTGPNAFAGGMVKAKLAVRPLGGDATPTILEGYVALSVTFSRDGTKVFFTGVKGESLDFKKRDSARAFVLDLATKKVESLPLPEDHGLVAASTDGKTLLISRTIPVNQISSSKLFLVARAEQPVEVFKGTDNIVSARGVFSPDGSKVLVSLAVRDPNGARLSQSLKEFEVLDVATGKSTKIKYMPSDGWLADWDWSPKGDRLVYLWRHPKARAGRGVARPGAGFGGGTDDKVYVSEIDGSNAKEIHKTTGQNVHTLIWR